MTLTDYTKFKGVSHVGNDDISNMIESNMKVYYDWSLLQIGGWTDVNVPQSGAYGGDFSQLRCVDDELYTAGQVWESAKKDWVWETGVGYIDVTGGGPHEPNATGALEIDGITNTSGFYVNYPLGRIIFDSPIATTSVVKMQYAFRDVQVYRAEDAPWWRELQFRSFRVDSSHFLQRSSGEWSIGGHHRIQLPCIIIEVAALGDSRPWQLGDGSLNITRDVYFHVLSETRYMRNNLMDWISKQSDKTIYLFNTNSVGASGDYPLDYRGMFIGGKQYNQLVDDANHRYRRCYFASSVITNVDGLHTDLYEATVRTTMEIVI